MVSYGTLAALLLVLSTSQTTTKPDGTTRAGLMAGYQTAFANLDTDGDKLLSLDEWVALANRFPDRASIERMRVEQARFLAAADTNRDGFLSIEELLRLPLATFDCADVDHSGNLSNVEISDSMPLPKL